MLKSTSAERLRGLRRFQTLYEMFAELNQHTSALDENRSPILLLLGGGMAAGKSTVREIIGHDEFWSKVRLGRLLPMLQMPHSLALPSLASFVHPHFVCPSCCCLGVAWLLANPLCEK